MDRFKEVNDTFGHASGDRVLEVLSERLTRVLSKDTVSAGWRAMSSRCSSTAARCRQAARQHRRSWRARC
jgi:GGDEF domain-containing protein